MGIEAIFEGIHLFLAVTSKCLVVSDEWVMSAWRSGLRGLKAHLMLSNVEGGADVGWVTVFRRILKV